MSLMPSRVASRGTSSAVAASGSASVSQRNATHSRMPSPSLTAAGSSPCMADACQPSGIKRAVMPNRKNAAMTRHVLRCLTNEPALSCGAWFPSLIASREPVPAQDLRKFSSSFLPSCVRMDSGWNCTPCTGCCLCIRPMISPSSVHAVISRQSGSVSRLTMSEW